MRRLSLAILIIAMGASGAVAQETTPSKGVKWAQDGVESFFGPQDAFQVTISSANGVVSVIDVPRGVILSVAAAEYEARELEDSLKYPRLFRGDMTIRTRRFDEVKNSEGNAATDLMAKAPLEVKLQGVIVSVAKVE
ncbi:MAG: hypothetical protein ACYDIE_01385 [Candidatus Krumholzibacteriia bacterium]